MRVKENDDGTLVLDGKILEGAREAYQEDRIVEAFTLLHAFIEWEMLNLYEHSHVQHRSKEHLPVYVSYPSPLVLRGQPRNHTPPYGPRRARRHIG